MPDGTLQSRFKMNKTHPPESLKFARLSGFYFWLYWDIKTPLNACLVPFFVALRLVSVCACAPPSKQKRPAQGRQGAQGASSHKLLPGRFSNFLVFKFSNFQNFDFQIFKFFILCQSKFHHREYCQYSGC